MKKTNNNEDYLTPSANSVQGQPQNVFELINKYGTYNIQPTDDSDNSFPKIAQGLARPDKRNKKGVKKCGLEKEN